MFKKSLVLFASTLALLFVATSSNTSTLVAAPASPGITQQNDGYVGADACKECHAPYVDAWTSTKHAKALNKLQPAEREGDTCIRCHVTGSAAMIKADGAKPRFPGVQCENCHGAGAVHIEQAKAKAMIKGAIVKTPDEDVCTRCHSSESPHYKPFVYVGMKTLVHAIKK
jgi:hypothetical protein